ncbi:FYN-binding protein 1 [Alosa sapidissima]|uniref:FYN-binding protein 1 n=1 Tax=Alosa sapidissima TaxID=34773 RepID=UPI001C0A42B1|nr:FYN-binding protein 1 [Alosa sapidissima]
MSVPVKGSSTAGVESSSTQKNPWSDIPKKNINRNVSSGVLKLGTKFENLSDTDKTSIPKPPLLKPVAVSKPSQNLAKPSPNTGSTTTDGSTVQRSTGISATPKLQSLGLKPRPLVAALQSKLAQENVEENIKKDTVVKTLSSIKPSFLMAQQPSLNIHLKSPDINSEGQKNINKPLLPKLSSNAISPKPLVISPTLPKPNILKPKLGIADDSNSKEKSSEDSAPKIKPLPNVFTLGKCPSKPKRPPHIQLDRFKSTSTSINALSSSQPIYLMPDSEASDTPCQEESYDDVGVLHPSPSLRGSTIQHSDSFCQAGEDEDMYEDLEERWVEKEQTNTKTTAKEDKTKCDKDEKKRLEQEKKEQKLREKKEREARKKFKLSGPVVVLQEVKARVDSKGGKNELPLTQGEAVEIVRLTDNPEGLWLGRNSEGLYGYVKTAALEIDHSALKAMSTQIPDGAGEVYDDVGVSDISFSPPPPPVGASPGNDDEVYVDVDSPPPPPSLTDHPFGKTEEADGKKKKKFEKEEKEFRKKFKYDGDISVLYQVMVDPALTTKKWGNKDLPLRPGETIDVIVKPQDGKLIGRNKDGKFGYVCLRNIQQESDIYDDVGEDCIYDN